MFFREINFEGVKGDCMAGVVRRVQEGDIERLKELVREFSGMEEGIVGSLNICEYCYEQDDQCTVMVLALDETIVGYGTLVIYPSFSDNEHNAYLDELFITSDFRGKGHGKEFLEGIRDWCARNQIPKLKLVTRANNIGAQRFYASNGGERKDKINYTFRCESSS